MNKDVQGTSKCTIHDKMIDNQSIIKIHPNHQQIKYIQITKDLARIVKKTKRMSVQA